MGRTKNIDKLYEDIEENLKEISKEFNKQVAENFKSIYIKEASDWYNDNTSSTDFYTRTHQLIEKPLIIEKEEEYGEKISFSSKKIKPKKGKKPTKRMGKDGVWSDYSGTLSSYYSWNKENIASDVLFWEEMGYWNFAQYGYTKGHGIFGNTLSKMIKEINTIKPLKDSKISLSKEIVNDLYELLKNKTKTIMQKRYIEMFF